LALALAPTSIDPVLSRVAAARAVPLKMVTVGAMRDRHHLQRNGAR